jgi:hypothetical protein
VGVVLLPLADRLTRLLLHLHPPLLRPRVQPAGHQALRSSLLCRRCAASWIRWAAAAAAAAAVAVAATAAAAVLACSHLALRLLPCCALSPDSTVALEWGCAAEWQAGAVAPAALNRPPARPRKQQAPYAGAAVTAPALNVGQQQAE